VDKRHKEKEEQITSEKTGKTCEAVRAGRNNFNFKTYKKMYKQVKKVNGTPITEAHETCKRFFVFVTVVGLLFAGAFTACDKDEDKKDEDKKVDEKVDENKKVHDEGVVINGVRWATINVGTPGTFVDKPEDWGMLYHWNSKIGWSTTDPRTSIPNGSSWTFSSSYTWQIANDPCPPGFRTPTEAEFLSLRAAGSELATVNGIVGRRYGSGTNSIFLPAVVSRNYQGGTLSDNTTRPRGTYWTSAEPDRNNTRYFVFYYDDTSNAPVVTGTTLSGSLINGFSCRCVAQE